MPHKHRSSSRHSSSARKNHPTNKRKLVEAVAIKPVSVRAHSSVPTASSSKGLIYSSLLLMNLLAVAASESARASASPRAIEKDLMCFSDKNSGFVPLLNIARHHLNLKYIDSYPDLKKFIVKAFPANLSADVALADRCDAFAPAITYTNLCTDSHGHVRVIFQPMVAGMNGTMEAISNATEAGCAAYDVYEAEMIARNNENLKILGIVFGGMAGLAMVGVAFYALALKVAECKQRATPQGASLLAGAAAPRMGGSYGSAAADAPLVVVPTAAARTYTALKATGASLGSAAGAVGTAMLTAGGAVASAAGRASAATGASARAAAGFFNRQTITGSRAMTLPSVGLDGPQRVVVPVLPRSTAARAPERQGLLASVELASMGGPARR